MTPSSLCPSSRKLVSLAVLHRLVSLVCKGGGVGGGAGGNISPNKRGVSAKYFFLFQHKNIGCGYSLKAPL